MRRTGSLLGLFCLLAAAFPAAGLATDFSPAVAEMARPAVVTIHADARTGSGFLISPEGYLLTNRHVVESVKNVRVRLMDRREVRGVVVGSGPQDVALIKLDRINLPTLRLGRGTGVGVGETVLMFGTPVGLNDSVSKGSIGHAARMIDGQRHLQLDGWVNPGNSGGPVVNLRGEVVGIVTRTAGNAKGIGFALPIEAAEDLIAQNNVSVETSLGNQTLGMRQKRGAGPKTPDTGGQEPAAAGTAWGWIAVASFAGLAGFGLGWFVCSRRRQDDDLEIILKE